MGPKCCVCTGVGFPVVLFFLVVGLRGVELLIGDFFELDHLGCWVVKATEVDVKGVVCDMVRRKVVCGG